MAVRARAGRPPGPAARPGVALARGVGLGVLIQRNLFAQHALLLEGGALDQVGMRARRAGLLGLRAGLPGLGRHGHGRLLASRRRRRRHQFGRHQVATLQRLEQRPSPEQGLLHLAGGTAGPEFARQFLDAHIATRCSMSPDPFRPRSKWPSRRDGPVRSCRQAGLQDLLADRRDVRRVQVPAACLSFSPSSTKLYPASACCRLAL